MQFASFTFLFLFFPITLGLYHLTPHRWKREVMLGISILFILGGGLASAVTLLLLTAGTYGAGLLLERLHPHPKLSGMVTALLVILEFGILLVLRSDVVQNWSVSWIRGADLFPLGLSFFILQSLDYCLEVRHGKFRAERRVQKLALYLLFYPRLIMGPVVSYRTAMKQHLDASCSITQIGAGMFRVLIGLAKKLLLANWLDMLYTTVSQVEASAYSMPILWLSALAKLLALYFELSGYADMAIGLAQCYGVKLPESYGKTIFYPTVTQFADQWNRTVVQWFFHYVGTRFHGKNRIFHVFAVMITWGCIGLWYDMRLTTLLWGMGVGFCIGVEYLLGHRQQYPIFRYVVTFLLLCIGTIFLVQPDLADALAYVRGMLGAGHVAPADADGRLLRGYWLILLMSIYVASGNWRTLIQLADRMKKLSFLRQPLTLIAVAALFIMDTALLVSDGGIVQLQLLL